MAPKPRRRAKQSKENKLNPGAKPFVPQSSSAAGSMVNYSLKKLEDRLNKVETFALPVVVDQKDLKETIESRALRIMKDRQCELFSRKGVSRPMGSTRSNPFVTRITTINTATSAANTVLTAVDTLIPNATPDGVIFATVFDESRCVSVDHHYIWATLDAAATPVAPLQTGEFAYAFDPSNAGPYTSVAQVLEAPHHFGPINYNAGLYSGPTHVGKQIMSHSVPPTVGLNLAAGLIGSNWVSASDTGAIIGYHKPYGANVGTAQYLRVIVYHVYHMQYSYRT